MPAHQDDSQPYGRYFCLEIDRDVVQGFNDDLVLEENSTMSNGAEYCDMTFMDANFTLPKMAGLAWKKTVSPGQSVVMPWEYHVGHLYKTLGEVITEELGDDAADVMATALKDFTNRFGDAAGEAVSAYHGTEFDRLPWSAAGSCAHLWAHLSSGRVGPRVAAEGEQNWSL